MRKVPWSIRAARRSDRERLRRFQCARDGSTAQLEVEEFIQADLLDWAFEPRAREGDPRLLLLLDGTSLVGVAAHERKTLQAPNGDIFAASKLEVVALARSWQGRSFPNGVRASDVLMSAVMQDIATRVPPAARGSSPSCTRTTERASPCSADTGSWTRWIGWMKPAPTVD